MTQGPSIHPRTLLARIDIVSRESADTMTQGPSTHPRIDMLSRESADTMTQGPSTHPRTIPRWTQCYYL